MLIRVSNHISKFPAHVVPILTSTVIECYRSGLKSQAFTYASMLIRPEYRTQLDPKFKRKIEQIVRRPEKEEAEESKTPCCFCSAPLNESLLDCGECKSKLPYCIATGNHMTLEDWSECPKCSFPALASNFRALVGNTGCCPMCNEELQISDIVCKDKPLDGLKLLAEVESRVGSQISKGFRSDLGSDGSFGGLAV